MNKHTHTRERSVQIMGQGQSISLFPTRPKGDFEIGKEEDEPPVQSADQMLDHQADNAIIEYGKSRSSLWILFFLFTLFVILVISTGIRCATDSVTTVTLFVNGTNVTVVNGVPCNIYTIPSVGAMITSSTTGPLAVTALNLLLAIHWLLTLNTYILIKNNAILTALGMLLSALGLYVMLYVALISPMWYMALTPIVLLGVWCTFSTYGLYRFYRVYPTRKLLFFSFVCWVFYIVPAILYIAFSAVDYGQVSGKDIAVLVCELSMLLSCCGYIVVLAFHTRRVKYRTEVQKGYEIID